MRAIILAAGMGKRLGMDVPKCTLRVGNEALIQRSTRLLREQKWEPLVVVGYNRERVEELMPDAQTIYNDKFERGSAYSLYLAREYLPKEGPFLFLHGDLLYHERLLHECAQAEGTCLVVGPRQECSDEEIVIKANDKEKVIKMKRGGTGGLEWRGIVRVAPEDRTELINVLRQDVSRSLDAPLWKSVRTFCYNSSVRILYSDAPWIEIDSLDDFREAREKIWPLIQNEEE